MAAATTTAAPPEVAAILLIDDDVNFCETAARLLREKGITVVVAHSGEAGMALAGSRPFDLVVIDLRLGDMLGTDVARALREQHPGLAFILISAFMDTEMAVLAMKIGALNVIDQPLALEGIEQLGQVARAQRLLKESWESRVAAMEPGSAAERLARFILMGCQSPRDLTNAWQWATCCHTSEGTLNASCEVVGIPPHNARNFMRMLRAQLKRDRTWTIEALLNVKDRRTLSHLFESAGIQAGATLTIHEFLNAQMFMDPGHPVIAVIRAILGIREIN